MKKTLALGGAAALVATIGLAAPAQAAPPASAGGSCVQAGIGTLKSLGLVAGGGAEADRLQHPGRRRDWPDLRRLAGGLVPLARSGSEAAREVA